MATQERKRRVAAQTGMYLAVVLGIAVVVNVLASGAYGRIDTTYSKRYTLSQGSGRLVRSLKEPIQIDAYVTRGLAQLDTFVRDLTDILKEYQRASGGKFKFTLIEANTDDLRKQAKDAGLEPMTSIDANAASGDKAEIAQGYMGIVLKYGSEKEVIPQMAPNMATGLEFWITNKVREVRDRAESIKHQIGVVTNKDELKLTDNNLLARHGQRNSPNLQQILTSNFPFYSFTDVDLKDGSEEINKDLAGLIITQPRKAYTEKELRRIDQFLMRGNKSLVIYASAVSLKPQDATMEATLDLHGLDKLAQGYGIDIKKDVVMDYGAQFSFIVPTSTGQFVSIRHPAVARVVDDPRASEKEQLLDTHFAGFFRLPELSFPFASSLELIRNKQPMDVELKVVARTTPQTSVITGETVDLKLKSDWKPKPPFKQQAVAAYAKGSLKSAFVDAKDDTIPTPERSEQPSRVLVVASGEFLTNPFAYSGNGQEMGGQFQMMGSIGGDQLLQSISQPYAERYLMNTIVSVKNTLDWMTGDSDLIESSAKIIGDANLTYSSLGKINIPPDADEATLKRMDEDYRAKRQSLQNSVQWSLTLGVPVLFALLGILRWRQRGNLQARRTA
jgi:ABC-type uncharacterized transport system involved in gliding motility auxiliary subunit